MCHTYKHCLVCVCVCFFFSSFSSPTFRVVLLPHFVSYVCTFVEFLCIFSAHLAHSIKIALKNSNCKHSTITLQKRRRKQIKRFSGGWCAWQNKKNCEFICVCVHSKENFVAHREQRMAMEKKTCEKNKESNWKSQKHKWTICQSSTVDEMQLCQWKTKGRKDARLYSSESSFWKLFHYESRAREK